MVNSRAIAAGIPVLQGGEDVKVNGCWFALLTLCRTSTRQDTSKKKTFFHGYFLKGVANKLAGSLLEGLVNGAAEAGPLAGAKFESSMAFGTPGW